MVGVQPGDKVLANAFSFTAVPSAIHHAGGQPVYVEATDGYVMCTHDLRAKIEAEKASGTPVKFLMLTHMRGKVEAPHASAGSVPGPAVSALFGLFWANE